MTDSNSKLLAALFAETHVFGIRELNERIREVLESEFFAIQVQGEISNFKRHTSGHWYFTLKDNDSQLRGVFFKQWNRLLRFEPTSGLEVRVRGRLSVYEPRGEYQIVVETMEPVGIGAMQLAFEQQVKRLSAEGLFDESRKRPLTPYPRRIGIITSPVGAVLRDILQILERRNPSVDILLVPVRVQGNGAGGEIADAIKLINKFSKQKGQTIDTLIVGRGGGSAEDLWAFNEEQVARAIFNSEIPVISAVGHETDYTISDFVADLRAPTPSAAAELVAADTSELLSAVETLHHQLLRAMAQYLVQRRAALFKLIESSVFQRTTQTLSLLAQRYQAQAARTEQALKDILRSRQWQLLELGQHLERNDFRSALFHRQTRLDALRRRLERSIQRHFEQASHDLAISSSKLDALSPLSVLGRGYTLVADEQGKLVKSPRGLSPGQRLHIRFEDGEAICEVV